MSRQDKELSSKKKLKKEQEQHSILGKRNRKERPLHAESDDEPESDHDADWKRKNLQAIEEDDDEIKQLERKLGIRTDEKRKKRYLSRIEEEGLGLGIFDFLEDIERNAKLRPDEYQRPIKEYKFNDPRYETALGASDVEDDQPANGAKSKVKAQ